MNWNDALMPIIKKYKNKKHPLEYKNRYQLLVMTLLSAQDSDKHINEVGPRFFGVYPSMRELAKATEDEIASHIRDVRNFGNKAKWLAGIAKTVGSDENIPTTMETLTSLKGIGRKSASVIIRESGGPAEGIIVDLHVVRVAPRVGVTKEEKPEKIEKDLMAVVEKKYWGDVGMAISFLGREICRPTNPKCEECSINENCSYFQNQIRSAKSKKN